MERAVVFIDGAYLQKVLEKDFDKPRIDFEKFSNLLCDDYERLRTYYYYAMPYQGNPPTEEERKRYSVADKFISRLRKLRRFEIRLGKLAKRDGEFIQKRVDILLAVDLVRLSWGRQMATAVVIAGDSDFVPAIQAAKDAGVLVRLYYSKRSVHNELLEAVDEYFEINSEIIEKCRI
jgi:uncharacterized LabA/DUF88 family protein